MKRSILLIIAVAGLMACQKKKEESKITPEAKPAKLLNPQKGSVCIDGRTLSDTQTYITFDWNDVEYATDYTLVVTSLTNNESVSYKVVGIRSDQTVLLERGKPYSWSVITTTSLTEKTSQSETWMFYSSAEGTASFAPFPASPSFPANNAGILKDTEREIITLSWYSQDPDDDIVSYDIYMSKDLNPSMIKKDHPLNSLTIDIADTGTYFWRIVSKDKKGNSSESPLYSFRIYR